MGDCKGRVESKRFFFEKKNQKTFAPQGHGLCLKQRPWPGMQSFFGSFCSQKERLPCLTAAPSR
jgi:hypothetical protein